MTIEETAWFRHVLKFPNQINKPVKIFHPVILLLIYSLFIFEKNQLLQAYYQEELLEAGCDEAGRGCLAGPVFAAAVILPKDFYHPLLNDSKQLNEKQRLELRPVIEKTALA